jgi:NDP-sugar pyrophosphorylase family protein
LKALIFAAGLGTRLKPITDTIPKALVPVMGKPLLEHIILKLKKEGFNEIIVNVHHFPDQIIDFIQSNDAFGIRIAISDERDELLDTGGGISNTAWFFDDNQPFLVHNVDILSNANLKELYDKHVHADTLATLLVSERNTFRHLLFDEQNLLQGWINEKTGETKPAGLSNIESYRKLAFAGIQMLNPEVFEHMKNFGDKFPVMDFYLSFAGTGKIAGYTPSNFQMLDIGKLDVIEGIEKNGLEYYL